ncbi:MAG: dihydropteroate synthase [Candidatus Latescibacteria bacterium]|nr:dihydropteroate synthase [Candidatus Latescibacterota bacterium]
MKRKRFQLTCGDTTLDLGARTYVMGVLNVTPDSFSDGGRFLFLDHAIKRVEEMVAEDVDMIDVGGESTRPGSEPVPMREELNRVIPVIERIVKEFPDVLISIDTCKADVAEQAIGAGARLINDVSAMRLDEEMGCVAAETGAPVILMHMKGMPKTMQEAPAYKDVVGEVRQFLRERVQKAVHAGIARDRLIIDPGIGFGKTVEHNLTLLARLEQFADVGCPILIGSSRKWFIGRLLGDLPVEERLEGTLASVVLAVAYGAHIVRVHDVRATVRAIRIADAIVEQQ